MNKQVSISEETKIRAVDIVDCSDFCQLQEGRRKNEDYILRGSYFISNLRNSLFQLLQAQLNLSVDIKDINLSSVPEGYTGDFSLQFNALRGKDSKSYVQEIVPDIVKLLNDNLKKLLFVKVETKGPYINIFLERGEVVKQVIARVLQFKDRYGDSDLFAGRNLMIDFSSPNMGKALHVGHVGTTLLGAVLSSIYKRVGYTVFRVNHLGDWGTPIGILKVGEELFGEDAESIQLRESPSQYYAYLYAKSQAASKDNQSILEEARKRFSDLENGLEYMLIFWERVRRESIGALEFIYKDLGIEFDLYLGESTYERYLEGVITDAMDAGLATIDGAAVLIDLEENGLGKVLLRKSDGSTTYMTRDLAAVRLRKQTFHLRKSVYVVGSEQNLHFRQLFHLASVLKYMDVDELVHVPIGLLTQGGKKISSRKGGGLAFETLLHEVYESCFKRMVDKNVDNEAFDNEQIAKVIGNAAIYYSQIQVSPGKNCEFHLDKITDTKGNSGPGIQYAAVRINSILSKIEDCQHDLDSINSIVWSNIDDSFFEVIKKLAFYPEILEACARKNTAHILTTYLEELRELVTTLIHTVMFREAKDQQLSAYNYGLRAILQVLSNGLELMNSRVPRKM